VLELPVLGAEAYLENLVPLICRGVALLPVKTQAALVRSWSQHSAERLKSMLENLQQILSLKVYTGTFTRDHLMNDDETITSCTSVIRIVYFASLLGGEHHSPRAAWDSAELPVIDSDTFSSIEMTSNSSRVRHHSPLSSALQLSPLDVRVPLIPTEEFYNEPLNDTIEMDRDFAYWKMPEQAAAAERNKFSFMAHPFILNPATKAQALYYDNRISMYSERRMNLFHSMMAGVQMPNPYLKLQVRRDHIVEDALVGLEVVVLESPQDLKKQLMVEFDSEQGIDEGGLSKEFFQLIVEEIFNPDYGMFVHCPETHTFWFNPSSYESCAQFTLIGIVLGLAMYNSVILDLHLPSVIYRKLQGKRGVFEDLRDFKRSVWRGLQDLLDYEPADMETVFVQPFQISYTDLFG
jgi:ubiquitin-protein ligase E3 A